MDIKKLVDKIEKYLHKELKYLMRETSLLDDLQYDIELIEEFRLRKAKTDKKSEILLKHYEEEAKQKEKFSERVERRLEIWIKRIEKLIIKEEKLLSDEEKKCLEKFRSHLELCKNNLIRILAWKGELHQLVEQGEDWEKVEKKIEEALGDTKNPGIRSLMVLINNLLDLELKYKQSEYDKKNSKKKDEKILFVPADYPGNRRSNLLEKIYRGKPLYVKLEPLPFSNELCEASVSEGNRDDYGLIVHTLNKNKLKLASIEDFFLAIVKAYAKGADLKKLLVLKNGSQIASNIALTNPEEGKLMHLTNPVEALGDLCFDFTRNRNWQDLVDNDNPPEHQGKKWWFDFEPDKLKKCVEEKSIYVTDEQWKHALAYLKIEGRKNKFKRGAAIINKDKREVFFETSKPEDDYFFCSIFGRSIDKEYCQKKLGSDKTIIEIFELIFGVGKHSMYFGDTVYRSWIPISGGIYFRSDKGIKFSSTEHASAYAGLLRMIVKKK